MKIDDGTKVLAAIGSVIALILTVLNYFTGRKVEDLQNSVQRLTVQAKEFDILQSKYDKSSKIFVELTAPLAKSFAELYAKDGKQMGMRSNAMLFPTEIASEFKDLIPQWMNGRGLMTGEACKPPGLRTRQVVVMRLTSIGYAAAEEVVLRVRQGVPPAGSELTAPWGAQYGGKIIGYAGIEPHISAWKDVQVDLGQLLGNDVKDRVSSSIQVVLARVSGSQEMYGTVLYPMSLSWTDSVTKERRTISKIDMSRLSSDLIGGDIGFLASVRKNC